eukprot:COSAG01_NODE_13951_length_1515_cov_1.260593_1_plen_148_part_10
MCQYCAQGRFFPYAGQFLPPVEPGERWLNDGEGTQPRANCSFGSIDEFYGRIQSQGFSTLSYFNVRPAFCHPLRSVSAEMYLYIYMSLLYLSKSVERADAVTGVRVRGEYLRHRPRLARAVSRPFPSWNRSILAGIYLCHACSCQEML